MSPALLLLVPLAVGGLQADAERAVRDRYERVGKRAPEFDDALNRAATALAARALAGGVTDASPLLIVTHAVSMAGASDPSPTALVLKAHVDDLPRTLGSRTELGRDAANALGLGVAQDGPQGALVLLLAHRRATLEAFPRSFLKPPPPQRLCARHPAPLGSAEVFITRPGGSVDRLDLGRDKKNAERGCATLAFPHLGRHTVELLARSPEGPVVTALFFVDVGGAPKDEDEALGEEPRDDGQARVAVLTRVNALRRSMGLNALTSDAALEAVAQAYAARMASEGFFAHVAPDGATLRSRLNAARYPFVSAGENLGTSSGPLAAHFGIEHSPGHRKNLLEPAHTRLGVGLARSDGLTVLVEVLASTGPETTVAPVTQAYDALDRARRAGGLAPLRRSPVLEALAQQHALDALAAQLPKVELPGVRALHERAFELMEEATAVTVDIFVVTSPSILGSSKNLLDGRQRLVGVGLVEAPPTPGKGIRYWVVVAYAATGGEK